MKTYEEMARDVLKRRDEELQKTKTKKTQNYEFTDTPPETVYPASPKKLRLLPKIAVPCAAAVLVGTVGVTVWNNNRRGEGHVRNPAAQLEFGTLDTNMAGAAASDGSVGYSGTTNAASRETKINILDYERFLGDLDDNEKVVPGDTGITEHIDKSTVFKRLDDLEYTPITCDGLPEYKLTTDSGTVYWLNFSGKWVWKNGMEFEAKLPDDIIDWLENNKDSIDLESCSLTVDGDIGENYGREFNDMTIDELNDMYGIKFDKLSELHSDWKVYHNRFGTIYKEYPPVVTESYAASGSREIISTLNELTYTTPNGAKLEISAELAAFPEMPELELSEEDYSVLNGHRALVMRAEYEGETIYGAVIQMGGDFVQTDHTDRTRVSIRAEGFSEEEFVKLLREYTRADGKIADDIVIHDTMPDYFRNLNPFSPVCGNLFDELDFEPSADINRYYGIEFDRITRLHGDWNAQHNDFGIYTRDTADEFSVSHEIVWTRNRINYTLPNTAEFYVEAQDGSLPPIGAGSFADGTHPEFKAYSRVNGFRAMIYHSGDAYDDREFPNGDTRFGAVVEIGGTVVHLSAAGLTEEEFLNVLREYTDEPFVSAGEPVAVEPVTEEPVAE